MRKKVSIAAVASGTLTQVQADEKYAAAQAKMDAYDGTTHLRGRTDHSKYFAPTRQNRSQTADR
jgi:hypothetical protein